MVFAFLSTTVLLLSSLVLFGISVFLFILRDNAYADLIIFLSLISVGGAMLAVAGSYKLYNQSMAILGDDFDKWYKRQKKNIRLSIGGKKVLALSNTIYGCLAYERMDEAKPLIDRFKMIIAKNDVPIYKYLCFSHMLSFDEKNGDISNAGNYLSEMYSSLTSGKFPANLKTKFMNIFEYSKSEVEFYTKTPEQLRTVDKRIAEQLNISSKLCVSNLDITAIQTGYPLLMYYYNTGLSYAILGDVQGASQYLGYIASDGTEYPRVKRVNKYIATGDINILLSKMP